MSVLRELTSTSFRSLDAAVSEPEPSASTSSAGVAANYVGRFRYEAELFV
jgi:hypothetical protein